VVSWLFSRAFDKCDVHHAEDLEEFLLSLEGMTDEQVIEALESLDEDEVEALELALRDEDHDLGNDTNESIAHAIARFAYRSPGSRMGS
jgi:hypothetical protein